MCVLSYCILVWNVIQWLLFVFVLILWWFFSLNGNNRISHVQMRPHISNNNSSIFFIAFTFGWQILSWPFDMTNIYIRNPIACARVHIRSAVIVQATLTKSTFRRNVYNPRGIKKKCSFFLKKKTKVNARRAFVAWP